VSCSSTPLAGVPAKFAYFSAGIFIAASGSVNLLYGISKGQDLASSAVWGGVSVAASITFALLLSGGYSISAALGSAGAGRIDAATQETATAGNRQRAQAAYDAARTELAGLKFARPVAELEAMRDEWRSKTRNFPWMLEPELARAKRRVELIATMASASDQLATAPAGRPGRERR
jgi:hypothetical protein